MLAAAGMKSDVCTKYTSAQISILAFALCNPAVIIPQMALIKQISSSLDCGAFRLQCPGLDVKHIPFSDLDGISQQLAPVKVHFYDLPPKIPAWGILRSEMLTPSVTPPLLARPIDSACIGEEVKIISPINLKAMPCPVNSRNREEWTTAERLKAGKALLVNELDKLPSAIQDLHAGGMRKEDQYLCLDTRMMEGKVLNLRDRNDKLITLGATNLADLLGPLAPTILTQLGSIMAAEIFKDKSDRPEKGDDTPKGVHPNFVRKIDKIRVKHSQRTPHPSKEIEDNPEEAAMLAEMIHLITIIVEHHSGVKQFHPDGYNEIKVFATKLPLNKRSMAYPFGSFVINVSISTKTHHDRFDKLFCVVIPFGDWTGGELCMFEPGFVFRLQPWDMVLFPSCDITHFNLDFEGVRLSMVLHSDKYGDQWIRNGNGWLPNDPEDALTV
ncbi:hypothetical protein K438DRAFT_1755576 [Mycena galopus ATCC 62051]|nr:hypothetical protein K438DRAFT_1755576 [Mycena galopus ATCC 62051]